MRKLCDIGFVFGGYMAHYEGYYDEKDALLPFVLYRKSYTYDAVHGMKTHKNKIDRYCSYKSLLRDIADRI